MRTALELVFLGIAALALVVLPGLVGVDSRDGNDWVNHPGTRR
ncbi:hypothetical protein BH24ACT26_BH24ACT26_02370 [soil metagenome]